MIAAAANPDAENPAVVLKTLEADRQANAAAFMEALGGVFDGAQQRGRQALESLSDDEWNALLVQSNGENDAP